MNPKSLPEARQQIDALDEQIQTLISRRARIAQQIAHIKQGMGDTGDHYRPSREAEVLRQVIARNQAAGGPLTDEAIARLMREIMSACLSLESPLTVAYLGPEGTYTQAAVLKHFGDSVRARANSAIDEIFREVESGAADYGVVPVENSTGGVVIHTLDELIHTKLRICGEVTLPVHHHLLSAADDLAAVTKVYSHPQSFAQCRKWLDSKLPHAIRETVSSNGQAARQAREEGNGTAAIASLQAGRINQLNILASNIEDDPTNTTRFLVIGKQDPAATGDDVTSVVMMAHRSDTPGALFKLLQPFADAGLDMSRIESRPAKGSAARDYYFFIDFVGHASDPKVRTALDVVQREAAFFKVLGAYPRAVL
ncbi:prephenate dehydratase [Sinimarinibacterium sp. CAU 1509]|uniref:prephenate dehydratase n=1 Tax=Sinimarinibacterium sp. CAU 1509 TaxID=2562283 RepID=UPI0010ACAE95|nr:prephenate dehydratase [Sinimarinibacterium sp. CAU 1509]TJY62212.1 prephenate dehydratase [Sinimarinibacterium sp. CAU 1509]